MSSFLDDDQPTPQQRQPPSAPVTRPAQAAAHAPAAPKKRNWLLIFGGLNLIILAIAGIAAWFFLMPPSHPARAAAKEAHARKGNVIGDLYLEGARRVRAREMKSMRDFQDWKLAEQEKGGAAFDADLKTYEETLKPELAKVNGEPGVQDLDELADTLQALGEGYKQ